MIQGFGQEITEISAFGHYITEVRAMGKLTWQKSIPDYLCFTALENGTFTLTIPAAVTPTYLSYVEWSKDGRTWNHTDNTSEAVTINVQVVQGGKVYWRGSGTKMSISSTDYSNFSSNARFDVSGYLMSLTRLDDFVDHNTFGTASYSEGLFRDNTKLVSAQDLVFPENVTNYCLRSFFVACTAMTTPPRTLPRLPSTANAANYFSYMFQGCTSLTSAPPLPSMKVGGSAYYHMFYGCTSLTTPPALPATTLGSSCYRGMFRGSGITTAPALPATTLQSYCYCEMFQDCKSLTTPPNLPAPTMVTYCYNGMFSGSGITTPPVISATSFNGGQAHCRYMFRNCKSLTTAAEINIDVLAANCYEQMYQYCTNLSHIKCLATDISATGCLTNWTDGVAASGTFIKDANTTWSTGVNGIPSSWIINPDYLCFTALDDNTQFTFTKWVNLPNTTIPSISYSMDDGDTWTKVVMSGSGNEDIVTTPAVNAGGKVLWKAEAARFALAPDKYSTFTANGRFTISGNIMSLLYGDNHYDKTDTKSYTYSFGSLFRDSTNLIDASQLKLPTGYLSVAALLGFFFGCTNLVHGAPLYAPNIPDSCCYWMYYGCTSMTEMPTIAATSMLKDNGDPCNYGLYYAFYNCSNMEGEVKLNIIGNVAQQVLDGCFSNCSKITSADLAFNATLGKMALRGAFSGCTSLNHVKCLATSFYDDGTDANGSLYNWLNNVSSTGMFIQASGVTLSRGKSGIPTGWVDIEKRTMPSGYKQVDGIYSDGLSGASLDIGYPVNMKYDRIEVAFKQDEISNGMVLQSNASVNGKCWFYNYNASGLAAKPFSIYTQDANGNQRMVFGNTIYSPLDTAPHYLDFSGDGTKWELTHNGVTKTPYTGYISDLPESCRSNTILFGSSVPYKGWIYYFRNYDKDRTLLADFVSCIRESDDCAGYYDFVTNTFKTSNNHSRLTAGKEI